jgi:hypothetical protein
VRLVDHRRISSAEERRHRKDDQCVSTSSWS